MCCALRALPVTDSVSDLPFDVMSSRNSSPHQLREDFFSLHSSIPSREFARREELPPPQHLLSLSQGTRDNQVVQAARSSPSPPRLQSPESTTGPFGHTTSRSASIEQSQGEPSFSRAPSASSHSSAVPSGQVCRYVCYG